MERFTLKEGSEKGTHIVADNENRIVIKFTDHKFNETQKVTLMENADASAYMALARVMREIGEWLIENHKEVL